MGFVARRARYRKFDMDHGVWIGEQAAAYLAFSCDRAWYSQEN